MAKSHCKDHNWSCFLHSLGYRELRHCSATAAPALSQRSGEDTSPSSQRVCRSTQTPLQDHPQRQTIA